MTRVLVAGVPRAGKTTFALELARDLKCEPLHTDDLAPLGWSESSAAAAQWFATEGPWIIEGVAVPRAIRKWLAANLGAPADAIYWLPMPRIALTPGQLTMAKGCLTVWREILPVLIARGVTPIRYPA